MNCSAAECCEHRFLIAATLYLLPGLAPACQLILPTPSLLEETAKVWQRRCRSQGSVRCGMQITD